MKRILGIDVGGANLKFAFFDEQGHDCWSTPFELWKRHRELGECIIQEALSRHSNIDCIAATMTGELADCYENKRQGVVEITRALEQATERLKSKLQIYGMSRFYSACQAERAFSDIAAANWYAIAEYLIQTNSIRHGLIIDCGSTTTDIIPVLGGRISCAKSDTARLKDGSLVYTGVRRSPVFGLVNEVEHRGLKCAVAKEFFATTQDVYLMLDQLKNIRCPESTADGRSIGERDRVRRLGKVICADEKEFNEQDAISIARQIRDAQVQEISKAMKRQLSKLSSREHDPPTVVVGGEGEFLIASIIEACSVLRKSRQISVASVLGDAVSDSLGAYAAAHLLAKGEPS